ncbi:MAG TPA: TetR/AcrR family transcriptional regulator [Acidimicrobiales bacterium]|nr:TetR/AcrR family transcriptional regulator [Acidimicrobiales bacterium]
MSDNGVADGRRARGERTRQRVVESLIELVEAGDLRPSAQRVADHAEVALRTVYHHFEDVEALRATANRMQFERHIQLLRPVDPSLPLDKRIALVSKQRQKLFEAITPMRRAALLDDSGSQVGEGTRESRELLRQRIEDAFAPELAAAGGKRGAILDAIDTATAWPNWLFLRIYLQRKPAEASRVVETILRSLLGA